MCGAHRLQLSFGCLVVRAFFLGGPFMKTFIILTVLLSVQTFAQDSLKRVTLVFYFGGSDCPYCIDTKNVENINTMRTNLPKVYPDSSL